MAASAAALVGEGGDLAGAPLLEAPAPAGVADLVWVESGDGLRLPVERVVAFRCNSVRKRVQARGTGVRARGSHRVALCAVRACFPWQM